MFFHSRHDKQLNIVVRLLVLIIKEQRRMADALKDLTDAVTREEASLSAELKAIADKLASFEGAVPAAAAEAIVTRINAVSDQLDAETVALGTGTGTGTV